MTDLQKQIIEIVGDKSLSMGCMFTDDTGTNRRYDNRLPKGLIRTIIGHPIHFGYLMKLNKESQNSLARGLFDKILNRFNNNLHLYSQDCLSWDEETNKMILDYLLTVKGN